TALILPLAHVGNNKKWITLVNPQAVNLDAYKEKLEQAIKSYERRLNLVIWRALPQEERDKFKEDGPVQYMQHKEALLESLENLGWPISYEDVILLEDEVLTALTYKQQASDLQEAAKKETEKSSESCGRTTQIKPLRNKSERSFFSPKTVEVYMKEEKEEI
uniref:Uncharacterized protein n=1 Tax=Melopsittacus undulatus TaxID=13146 RepID=A0A8C6ILH4_MELUD